MVTEQKDKTILIVDDTPENLTVLNALLSETCRIKVATNGPKAIEIALSDERPDLILLDIMMPGMDGYEVCRRVKADKEGAKIPIMFLTAKTATEDEVLGFNLGAVDYVTKPINPNRLIARIQTQLDLADAHRKLEEQNEELIEAAKLREDVERITRHDLKSPLTTIIGVPQYVMMTCDLSDDAKEMLEAAEDAGHRMLQMINMSLDLFKMERGTYQLNPRPVNMIESARKVFVELRALSEKKSLDMKVLRDAEEAGEDQVVRALGETLLCHSLLANLCKNAIEAAPDGSTVAVNVEQAGDGVVTTIENEGEVPEDVRERFFDKFATSGKSGGTGLGTYSARLITETQNGMIELDATTPGSTRVRVILPSADAESRSQA